ncbi:hypothetical protein GCM10010151_60930 [Actinoallomurus spadix]|uniref:DUF397 domain-containing protein n=1 Tax=Actinoallomurus spadix TaxID=79912 RepID=A0ABN0XG19_9ACTN
MVTAEVLRAQWRTSSWSGNGGACVSVKVVVHVDASGAQDKDGRSDPAPA